MDQRQWGSTGVLLELDLGVSGLDAVGSPADFATGLVISTKCDVEEAATSYAADSGQIETIETIGVHVAPTSGKCRFRETDTPGTYALYLADARFAVEAGSPSIRARTLLINFRIEEGSPANPQFGFPETGISYQVQLTGYDPYAEPVTPSEIVDAFPDLYQAKVWMQDDEGGTADRYSAAFYKNSQPNFEDVEAATLQVIKVSDGTDLIAETSMTQIGSTGMFKFVEASDRMVSGEAYLIVVRGLAGSPEEEIARWVQPMGRDSAA